MPRLMTPATEPFVAAMVTGSPPETFWVRLLSMAQHTQAAITASAPAEIPNDPLGCQLRTSPPAMMRTMPSAMRRSKFSWNTNQARSAVNTPSRFSSSDADAAGVERSPAISNTGASTPPNRIAPASHGLSRRESDPRSPRRTRPNRPRPAPDPRYRSPARKTGGSSPTRRLAKGVLAPKRVADARARAAPREILPGIKPPLPLAPPLPRRVTGARAPSRGSNAARPIRHRRPGARAG